MYFERKRGYLKNFGCKVNLAESNEIIDKLSYYIEFQNKIENADVILVNTCAVTSNASRKCITYIRHLLRYFTGRIIVVMGCLSTLMKEELKKMNINIVLDNSEKDDIIFLLKAANIINDKSEHNYFNNNYRIRTRGFLKVQDGCDNYCSYCIIPYLRGYPRSKPINDIISEFKDMIHKGYKEIVLVGIHLGKYGVDIGTSLYSLLKVLIQVEGEFRIRLSSLEVNEIKGELISLIKENNRICPHLHIPLQSGSNRILELMNRKYSSEEFVETVSSIRRELPLLRIGLDVIVGFPGESVDDFNETAAVIDKVKPDYMHIFPYSDRIGTKAYNMKDKVQRFDVKLRASKLRDLAKKLEVQSYQKMLGKYVRVLLENESTGYSDNYFKVKSANYYKENTFKEFYIDKFDKDNRWLIGIANS